jgi:hypothetical protein
MAQNNVDEEKKENDEQLDFFKGYEDTLVPAFSDEAELNEDEGNTVDNGDLDVSLGVDEMADGISGEAGLIADGITTEMIEGQNETGDSGIPSLVSMLADGMSSVDIEAEAKDGDETDTHTAVQAGTKATEADLGIEDDPNKVTEHKDVEKTVGADNIDWGSRFGTVAEPETSKFEKKATAKKVEPAKPKVESTEIDWASRFGLAPSKKKSKDKDRTKHVAEKRLREQSASNDGPEL